MKTKTNGRVTASRRQRQANMMYDIHRHNDHFDRQDFGDEDEDFFT